MMPINREWHEKNRMPKNATDEQRLKWHLEHAKHCDCRPLTKDFEAKLRAKARR